MLVRRYAFVLCLLGAILLAPHTTWAQYSTFQKISSTEGNFTGPLDDGDVFGLAMAAIGDLDGNGVTDLAVGAWGDDDGGAGLEENRGAVYVLFMNADGTVLNEQKISSTQGGFTGVLGTGDFFGSSIAALGDLDADGVPDIAVGAQGDDDGGADRGAMWVLFLNADGTVKAHQMISDLAGGFTGTLSDGDVFGSSAAGVSDLDADGVPDMVVGAEGADGTGTDQGAVWVLFLNADGTVKGHQKIANTEGGFTGTLDDGDRFGVSVASLNGRFFNGLAVGADADADGGPGQGAVWILFLNTDGTVDSHQKISSTDGGFTGMLDNFDSFGASVSLVGDQNEDGTLDLAVGALADDDGGTERGAVWILSLNGGGTVGSHQKISSTDGGFTGTLDNVDLFGFSLANIGDLDGDGAADLVTAALLDDDGGSDRGALYVLFQDAPDATVTPASFDVALLSSDGPMDMGMTIENTGELDLNWTATASGFFMPATLAPFRRGPAGPRSAPRTAPVHRADAAPAVAPPTLDPALADAFDALAAMAVDILFEDDMESGFGNWTTELYNGTTDDLWHLSDITSASPTMSMWPGVDGQGNYDTGNYISTASISPVIDLTSASTPISLFFMESYNTELNWDYVAVDVSTDGGATWDPLRGTADADDAPSGNSGGWVLSGYDLSAYAGSTIQVRFFFDTEDEIANTRSGWFVDDVLVATGLPFGELSVTPMAGVTAPGGNDPATVTINPGDLTPGDYVGEVVIDSDDPGAPSIQVPVNLTVADPPFIEVTSPDANSSWYYGSTQSITWDDNLPGNVRILLFRDGAFLETIIGSTPSDGAYDWIVPDGLTPGAAYSVRIRDVVDAGLNDDSESFVLGPPVTFSVDLEQMTLLGVFDAGRGDQVQVRGNFNGWTCADGPNCVLDPPLETATPGGTRNGGEIFSGTFAVPNVIGEEIPYKFYIDQNLLDPISGWEEPLDVGGGNRTFMLESETEQILDTDYFNDVRPGNIIPAGTTVDVTFQVNMAPATAFTTRTPFNPEEDIVRAWMFDAIWFTTYLDMGGTLPVELEDPDGDLIYEGTLPVTGPIYNGLAFKYAYENGIDGNIFEGEFGDVAPGRFRVHYIPDDGVVGPVGNGPSDFPVTHTFPLVDVQEFNPLPFEPNPTDMGPPTVQVLTPNGGQSWTAGTTQTISWIDNLTENVRIILLKGGAFDRTIIASTPSDGDFAYDVPPNLEAGADYAVRIRSVNTAAISDDSDATFSVPESIVVTSPPPGTVWNAGTTQNITWTSNVTNDVRVLLFKGGVFHQTLEVATPNDGFIFFPIPTTLAPATDYAIRIRLVSNAAIRGDSDPFEVATGQALTVTSPNGGEVLTMGTTVPITWTDDFAENVRIFLFRDGGFFQVIVGSTPSDGSFDWTIPTGLTPGANYSIRVRKSDNYLVRDDSDANFELEAGMSAPVLLTTAASKSGAMEAIADDGVMRWEPVAQAEAYRIELAPDTSFASVIVTADLDASTTTYAVREALEDALLAVGAVEAGRTYAVRIQARAGEQASAWAEAALTTEAPETFVLEGNYPNPFNPATTIRYALKEATAVRLAVYDVLGREVALLVDGPQVAGRYQMRFDATSLPSGVYYYRIQAGAFETVRPMLLAK